MGHGTTEAIEAARKFAASVFGVEAAALRVDGVQAPKGPNGWSVLVGHTREVPFDPAKNRGPGAVVARSMHEYGFTPSEYVRHWVRLDPTNDLNEIEPYVPPE